MFLPALLEFVTQTKWISDSFASLETANLNKFLQRILS